MVSNLKTIDRILQNRALSHFLFWASFVLIFTLFASLNSGGVIHHFINYLTLLPTQMTAAYFFIYFQIPQLLLKKKYIVFALSFLGALYFFSVIARISVVYIAEPFIREVFEQETIIEIISDPYYLFVVYVPAVYTIVFLLFAIKLIKERFDEKHQIEVLLKEKAANELKFLKAQIHPHFLFNTLNSLYALTLAKSDAAPEMVVKLSEFLDYIIYQCSEDRIALHKEIELIQGYLDLESLRYGKELNLKFIHKIDDPSIKIAPLILLSIIENAFKHGAAKNPINPQLHIDLKIESGHLFFSVFNTKLNEGLIPDGQNINKGIGATNMKRQLELNYLDKYELEVEDTPDAYSVLLKIELN